MGNFAHHKKYHQSSVLEGQQKINAIVHLKVNPFKKYIMLPFACLLTCFLLLPIMKIWQQAKLFMIYDECQSQQATHVLIFGIGQIIIISQIIFDDENQRKIFFYKEVKFEINKDQFKVVSFKIQDILPRYQKHIINGLSSSQYQISLKEYGYCQHPVKIPTLLQFMFHQLTNIFIIIQYVINIIYLAQHYYASVISNFCILFLILTINFFLQRNNLLRIKQIAQKEVNVEVLRDSVYKYISSRQLVPGDLFVPNDYLACDAILLRGQIYVNEAGLTGQNIPIAKNPVENIIDIKQTSILHEGSKVVEARVKPLALVLYTGFITMKGRILRKVLFKHLEFPQFLVRTFFVIIQTFVICLIIYIIAAKFWLQRNVNKQLLIFQSINLVGDVLPFTFLTFLNFCYTFSMYRLKSNNVLCTQVSKTIDSGKVKIMCFDKTGTLTKNIIKINSFIELENIKQNTLKQKLFATCHSIKKIQNQYYGDQLELCIYKYSEYIDEKSNDPKIISVYKKNGIILQVLKIYQFQSKFQSMSVIIRDISLNKYYIFIKGAPEKIYDYSMNKPINFNSINTSLSLKGLRLLGFGYKQITDVNNINYYLKMERQQLEKNVNFLGIMAFEDQLKQDCIQTIDKLKEADIQIKMITGDNIYLAVETAMKSHILSQNQKILVFKGNQQKNQEKYIGQYLYRENEIIKTQNIQMTQQEYLNSQLSIAIDNNFLLQKPKLLDNIKIFARTLPESKANIVKRLKQQKLLIHGIYNRLFGKTQLKIGMVGDETNDLMAMKQADVGIGFNNTESGFISNFSINNLIDIEYIIREGKSCITILVQVIRFNILINIEKYVTMTTMTINYSSYGDNQYQILTYPIFFLLAILLLLGKPSKTLSKKIPNDNLFSVGYNVAFLFQLSSFTICSLILATMLFSHPQFVPTIKKPNLWTLQSQPNTVLYISNQLYFTLNILLVFRSDPWKSKIWQNYFLFIWWIILLIISICVILFVPFNSTSNRILDIIRIPQDLRISICLITIASALLGIGSEQILRKLKDHQFI